MLSAACASLRTAGPGCGGGVQTWRWVQQACVLRQAHTRQDAAASRGNLTATTDSDTASGCQGGSETANIGPEASSGSRLVHTQQQRAGRGLQQLSQDIGSLSGVAAGAAEPAGAATPAALHPSTLKGQGPILHKPYSHMLQGPTLHEPYSHLLQCQYTLKQAYRITIASALCTDIEALQFAHGSCSVQVSFVSHPADWDIGEYVQQHPVMQQLQQVQQWVAAQASDSAAGSTSQAVGPFQATLTRPPDKALYLNGLPVQHIMKVLGCGSAPHAVVLQERLISNRWPHFVLHTMPVSREAGNSHGNKLAQMISCAGEGPGLQVFIGSVPEVAPANSISSDGSKQGGYVIPMALACSQLPADATYPLKLTLILMDSPGQQGHSGRQLGQWQVKAYKKNKNIVIRFGKSHKLSEYVGYSIAKAALPLDPTQGARLTLTLEKTVEQPCFSNQ